jgi:hypothetical protein
MSLLLLSALPDSLCFVRSFTRFLIFYLLRFIFFVRILPFEFLLWNPAPWTLDAGLLRVLLLCTTHAIVLLSKYGPCVAPL